MATSRRSSGSRPAGGAGTTRRPANRSSRPTARSNRTSRPRVGAEKQTKASASTKGSGSAKPPGASSQKNGARASVTGRAAVLAIVVAVLLVSYAYPLRTWFEQHGQRSALEDEAAQLEESVDELEREVRLWEDPAYVESMARERLNFVMPDEQGYVVAADPDAEDNAAVDEDGLPPADQGEWYERLWTSVEVADTTAEDDQ